MGKKELVVVATAWILFEEDGKDRTRMVEGLIMGYDIAPTKNESHKYEVIRDLNGVAIGLGNFTGFDDVEDIFLTTEEIKIPVNTVLPLKEFRVESIKYCNNDCVSGVVTTINYC